jgi:hypothetical protein
MRPSSFAEGRRGCPTCTASHLAHGANGFVPKDSDFGLELVASGTCGPEWEALYVCPSCGSYRRSGVIEASKDWHSVWLPVASADDLAPFRRSLRENAEKEGIAESELIARIMSRAIGT